jgi:hypothetical protein
MAARSWIIKAALLSQLIRLQAQTLASEAHVTCMSIHLDFVRILPPLHNQDSSCLYQNPAICADAIVRFVHLRRALDTISAIAES